MERSLPHKRVITGVDADGQSTLLEVAPMKALVFDAGNGDGDPPWVAELWVAERLPPEAMTDGPLEWTYQLEPPRGGAVFRIAHIPPDAAPGANDKAELRFGMHKTDSVDYLVILSGRIRLILEDGSQVELGCGDTVVQQATKHAWWNPGPEPCVMCAVLVSTRSTFG